MSGHEKIAKRVRIEGRVQGVFFRDSLRTFASRNGVSGWVRNVPDGSVEAQLEGSPEAVSAVIEYCKKGPPGARVERVKVEDSEVSGRSGFWIVG